MSFTSAANLRSRAVMQRLGMRYRGVEEWYERALATYEITAGEWRASEHAVAIAARLQQDK